MSLNKLVLKVTKKVRGTSIVDNTCSYYLQVLLSYCIVGFVVSFFSTIVIGINNLYKYDIPFSHKLLNIKPPSELTNIELFAFHSFSVILTFGVIVCFCLSLAVILVSIVKAINSQAAKDLKTKFCQPMNSEDV